MELLGFDRMVLMRTASSVAPSSSLLGIDQADLHYQPPCATCRCLCTPWHLDGRAARRPVRHTELRRHLSLPWFVSLDMCDVKRALLMFASISCLALSNILISVGKRRWSVGFGQSDLGLNGE